MKVVLVGWLLKDTIKLSYLTVLLIAGISFWSSCFIAAGGIANYLLKHTDDWYLVICASLSPLVSFGILIFPIPVDKSAGELGFTIFPRYFFQEVTKRSAIQNQSWNFRDLFSRCLKGDNTVQDRVPLTETSDSVQDRAPLTETSYSNILASQVEESYIDHEFGVKKYRLYFYPCSHLVHTLLHFLAVIIGLVLGWFTVIKRFRRDEYSTQGTIELTFTIISMLCCVSFIVASCFEVKPKYHHETGVKRWILYFEFLGLFFYMMALLYVSVCASDLIYGEPCP